LDVKLIKKKNEAIPHIKAMYAKLTSYGWTVTQLRTDAASMYVNGKEFVKWLEDHNIRQQHSSPYTKNQNGMVERHVQVLEDRVTAALYGSGLNNTFWGEAMSWFATCWNSIPSTDGRRAPYEVITGRIWPMDFLKPFGCRVYVRRDPDTRKHLDHRADPGILLGYSLEAKGYRVALDSNLRTVYIRSPRDCDVRPDVYPKREATNSEKLDVPPVDAGPFKRNLDVIIPNPGEEDEPPPQTPPLVIQPDPQTPPLIIQPAPQTPPLIIQQDPVPPVAEGRGQYSSVFMREVGENPPTGLRSGRVITAEVDMISSRCCSWTG
jgi:hypothetical protein